MKKLSKFLAFKKGAILGMALTASTILTPGCQLQQNTKIDTPIELSQNPEDYHFHTEKLGSDQNALTICKLDSFNLDNQVEISNHLNNEYKVYVSQLADQIDASSQDENTRNYLAPYLTAAKHGTFNKNLDGTMRIMNNEGIYIFTDLIKAIPANSQQDRIKFCYLFEILLNETYKRSFPHYSKLKEALYIQKKNHAIKNLNQCGITKAEITSDIGKDCAKTVAAFYQVFTGAVGKLNHDKNLQITPQQAQQLLDLVISEKFLESMHDSMSSGAVCGIRSTLHLEPAMETAVGLDLTQTTAMTR